MKKYAFLVVALVVLALSACGKEEKMDKATVLNKSSEAVESLNSYSVEMDMDVETMEMESNIKASGDITHSPDSMHLLMEMGMAGMSMDFETYMQEDQAYMSMFGEWIEMDPAEMGLNSFDQINKEEMEKLKNFTKQFEMTEKEDVYVLTLNGEGEEFSVLVEELVQSSMGSFMGDEELMSELVESINVKKLDLEIQIDKDTFYLTSQTIDADLEIVEMGTPTEMKINGEFTISNINKVEPIVVPEEVKANAVEEPAFDSFGEELSVEEIQERVDYTVPQVTVLPEGYSLTESILDEEMGMVMLSYDKDMENGFILTIYEEAGMAYEGEEVMIQGHPATVYEEEFFVSISWEQDGVFLELAGGGPELTREKMIEIAASIK